MEYPKSVLTKTQQGKIEARVLLSKGKFVEYLYKDPKTGEVVKGGKRKLCLKDEGGVRQYMIIPLKGERSLLIESKEEVNKEIWNEKRKVAVLLEDLLK